MSCSATIRDASKFVNKFRVRNRVRIVKDSRFGKFGTVVSIGGDDGTVYGVIPDGERLPLGYYEDELEAA